MHTSFKILDNGSKRQRDENGYLIVKNNPIAKSGVFDYYQKEVDNDNSNSTDIVKVCRKFEDLESKKDFFSNKPIVLSHQWVGEDILQADGVVGSVVTAKDPYLYADLIIYNPELIEKIESGEIVEISPGYKAIAKKSSGVYDGNDYQYLQELESVNHIAIVEKGRSGSDLRIQDKGLQDMKSKFLDKFLRRYKDEDVDKREIIREILAIASKPNDDFDGGEDEKFDEVLGLLEKLGYDNSEDKEKVTDEEKDKKVDDKDDEKVEDDDDYENDDKKDKKVDDEDDALDREQIVNLIKQVVAEEVKKSTSKMQDSAIIESKRITDAYNRVSSVIGFNFNNAGMSEKDIYAYGYEAISKNKLDKSMDSKTAFNIVALDKVGRIVDEKPRDNKVIEMLKKVNRS